MASLTWLSSMLKEHIEVSGGRLFCCFDRIYHFLTTTSWFMVAVTINQQQKGDINPKT